MSKKLLANLWIVEPDDKDYPLAMCMVPNKEQYTIAMVSGVAFVPLYQVIDAISGIKPNIIKRNGVSYCPNCGRQMKVDELKMIQCAEIVRCNSCTHWQNGHICKKFSKFGTIETESNFYCGYGEEEGDSLGKTEGDSTTQRQLRGT